MWDTPEAFHKFRTEQLIPAIRETPGAGGDGPPGPRCAPGAQANHRLRPVSDLVFNACPEE